MEELCVYHTGAAPTLGTPGAAAYDLTARLEAPVTVYPGRVAVVPLALRVALPPNVAMLILPRSGLAGNHGVTLANAPGLVDPDYRGEVSLRLTTVMDQPYTIQPGERVAQAFFVPFVHPEFIAVERQVMDGMKTERGESGFGHTGRT